MGNEDIPLTTALPHIEDRAQFLGDLEQILDSRVLTNRASTNLKFEAAIADQLNIDVDRVTSCANGTLGLEIALKSLKLKGKIIVTPFTFVASVHACINAGLEPVFADIDPVSYCLDPKSVEKLLSPDVVAVMPVHVYGNVCDLDYFESLRGRGIKVIYDSAHAFGVQKNGVAIGSYGDAEVFSFHATKIVNACEGGAIIARDPDLASEMRLMTNFGISDETHVELIGTNAKLSEVHSLFGLYSLRSLSDSIAKRRNVAQAYREQLADISALKFLEIDPTIDSNFQYFPVFIESQTLRDKLYAKLRAENIIVRKYFYPLVNHYDAYYAYRTLNLPNAERASGEVLCLPIHALMDASQVELVCRQIRESLLTSKKNTTENSLRI